MEHNDRQENEGVQKGNLVRPGTQKGKRMNISSWIFALILASLVFLVFSGTVGHQFVNYDDDIYVYENQKIFSMSWENTTWFFTNFYYYAYIPVTMVSHMIDYALWRADARGHHLTNVLLHAFNSAWVFFVGLTFLRVVRRKNQDDDQVFSDQSQDISPWTMASVGSAALLFAVHPLRAESVAWVSDRKDLLCAFFLLPAMLAYTRFAISRGSPSGSSWYLAAFALFVLAVLSKSIAVVFPIILLLFDCLVFFPNDWRRRAKGLLLNKSPFFVVSAVIVVLSFQQSPGEKIAYAVAHLEGTERLLFPFHAAAFYLLKTLLPFDLSPIYPAPESTELIVGVLVVLAVSALTIWCLYRKSLGMALAWFTYLVWIVPTIGGLSSGMQAVADRYSYLASIALLLVPGVALAKRIDRWKTRDRVVYIGAMSILCIVSSVLTLRQTELWKTPESLWGYVVDNFPPKPDYVDAYVNLGSALGSHQRYEEARQTLEEACALDPLNGDAFYNLGYILYVEGRWDDALHSFKRATEVAPKHARAFFNLGILQSQFGRDDLAEEAMKRAARLEYGPAQRELRSRGVSW
jgi:tetratricopeptide (TPR) repeat protein